MSLTRESLLAACTASITSFNSVSGAGPPEASPTARRTGSLDSCSTSSPSGAITSAADFGTPGMEVCSSARTNPKITSSKTSSSTRRIWSRIRQTSPKNAARADPMVIRHVRISDR